MPSLVYKITVAKPCHEDWENMLPAKDGRHCNSCQKNVIDFSIMTDEAVQNYFINNNGAAVCGRFKPTQLERIRINIPTYVFQKKISTWKKYLVILLLCFGSTVFSVDVFFGGGNLYAQTQVSKKHFKKKKYKVRYSYKEPAFPRIECTVAGFTVTEPVPEKHKPLVFIQPGYSSIETTINIIEQYDNIFAANTNHSDKDDPPVKKQSHNTEFILPAPLVMRRRASNRK